MRGTAARQVTMLGLVDPDQLIPADHPIRDVKPIVEEALRRPDGPAGAHRTPHAIPSRRPPAGGVWWCKLDTMPQEGILTERPFEVRSI